MAVHAGTFYFDDRPPADERRALHAGLQVFSQDDVATCEADHVVMASGTDSAWAGEHVYPQPRRSSAALVITWDGRLDNRDDLLLSLEPERGADDAAIALAAFGRWGVDGLRRLVGDWTLALWDARRRQLHLARDYMGVRPLFYCLGKRSVRWSSSLAELVTRAGCVDDLDEAFVAGFMALQPSTDVTPYRSVRAVPTAHCVSFSLDGKETRQRFWQLEPGIVRYGNRHRYEEHLRALWQEAVGTRLRADGTIWAELSGGLDSSSVVCMADALISGRRVAASRVQPLSHVALRSPEADERRFIAVVESRVGISSHLLGIEQYEDLRDDDWSWVTPLQPSGVQLASARHVRQHGGRIVLSGRMGDLVMGSTHDNGIAVCDDLARGDVARALSMLRLWSRASRRPFLEVAGSTAGRVLRPRRAAAGRPLNASQRASCALLTDRLRQLVDERPATPGSSGPIRLSQCDRAAAVLGYSTCARLETPCELGAIYAYPFAHRPLVEYLLAIPGEELSAPGEPRSLMRRAFSGLVPARILNRFSKGHYSPAVLRSVRPLAAQLLAAERLEVVRREWISRERLEAAARNLLGGGGLLAAPIEHVLRLEQWLTSRDRRAPVANPQGKEVTTNEVLRA